MIMKGELVHIPQDAYLLRELNVKNSSTLDRFIKIKKPVKALFWEVDSKNPKWGFVYYKNTIWTTRMKDIYPITKERENAS